MKLIDADKLNEEVTKWLPNNPCGIAEYPLEADFVVSVLMEIDEAPSIEIVRCGECKYFIEYKGIRSSCIFHLSAVNADDFCSYGEREGE